MLIDLVYFEIFSMFISPYVYQNFGGIVSFFEL